MPKSLLVRLTEDEEIAADVAERNGHKLGIVQRPLRRSDCVRWRRCEEDFLEDLVEAGGYVVAQAKCPENCSSYEPTTK